MAAMTAGRHRLAFWLLTALFLAIYWVAARDAQVHLGGDTTAFEEVARHQLSWTTIFSTQRPPIYPALFRLLDFSRPSVAAVQVAAYVAAWVFLAASLGPGRPPVAACVFYVALYPGFAAWNHVLMSESLATSLSVVAFAFLVRFLDGRAWAFWPFVAVMCLKCFLRGFDSILGLFYIPLLIGAAAMRGLSWRSLAGACLAFVACFAFVNRTTGGLPDSVWYFALMNNIGSRVLPDPAWLAYFEAHGMPVNAALLAMTGALAHEQNMRFFLDPDLAAFRTWVIAHGRSTYTSYLLVHPRLIFALLWQHRSEVFLAGRFPYDAYFDPGYRLGVPPWPRFAAVYAGGTLGSLAIGLAVWRGRVPPALVLPCWMAVGLWAMLLPIALCIYHADAGEISRHALPLILQAALALLLMIRVLVGWRAAAPPAP
jgi:hypothetical protein